MKRHCDRCGVDCAVVYVRVEQQAYMVEIMSDEARGNVTLRTERVLCVPCTKELGEWVRGR